MCKPAKGLSLQALLGIGLGGYALVPLKGFDKIAQIVKAAAKGNFGNGFLIVPQHFTGDFNPVTVEIINGGFVGHFPEKAAEIFG